mmetsp:Transcript_103440/g.275172  ORF Transcript_103440/g.275172 Transcript_103440/m.275172 type:complete len:122 (-) Transcript_103440:83-448(-)
MRCELEVLSAEDAQRIWAPLRDYGHWDDDLRDYEAVLRVPRGMQKEEVGRILLALVERRRTACGQEPLIHRPRLPRFKLVAWIGNTFLHFGGSVGCGPCRWRSCPSRALLSERSLSVSLEW